MIGNLSFSSAVSREPLLDGRLVHSCVIGFFRLKTILTPLRQVTTRVWIVIKGRWNRRISSIIVVIVLLVDRIVDILGSIYWRVSCRAAQSKRCLLAGHLTVSALIVSLIRCGKLSHRISLKMISVRIYCSCSLSLSLLAKKVGLSESF